MRLGAMRLTRAGLTMLVMALTLLLSACGAPATSARTGGAAPKTTTPTPTVTIPTLNWRKLTLPIDISHGGVSLSVSPVNGRDAWICGGNGAGQFTIWRTQDAGATWSQASSLSPVAPAPTVLSTACSVVPDQNLATSVAIWLPTGDPNNPGPTSSALAYYSSDGGVTWTEMPQNWWIDQIATSGNTTYALVNDLAHQSNINVFASSDHFTTWRSINPTTQEDAQNPPVLWVAPTTGDALLVTHSFNQFYHSTDGGNHWTLMGAPSGQSPEAQLVVWRGQSAGWLICGGPGGPTTQLQCSTDLGKTWTTRPAITDVSCIPVGLTSDGSLYGVCLAETFGTSQPYALMRQSLGASAWTAVGRAPDKYITVTQSGRVWCNTGDGSATYVLDKLP